MMKTIFIFILEGRQIQKGVESRAVKVVIAVLSQQCVIVVDNLRCPLSLRVITSIRQGHKKKNCK